MDVGLDKDIIAFLQVAGISITAIITIWTFGSRVLRSIRSGIVYIMTATSNKIIKLSDHDARDKAEHSKIFEAIESLHDIMTQLMNEWKPNSGTSQADKLDRIEKAVAYNGAFQISTLHTWSKAIFITDENGLCTYVNAAHSRLTGFRPDECMGNNWINVIEESERSGVFAAWKASVINDTTFDRDITYVKPGNINPYKVRVHTTKIGNRGLTDKFYGWLGEVSLLSKD